MKKNWKCTYNGYTIEVKNTMSKCELYVNDKMIAEHKGLDLGANLIGKLDNGETVLAVLTSGMTDISCDLYIVKEKLTEISEN